MKIPSKYVRNKSWQKYQRIIAGFLDNDAGRQTIIWAKHVNQMLSHGEDSIPHYYRIEIEALCYYNAFRNWPINQATVTGELDEENLSIMVSKNYIDEHGYLNDDGYWEFNWAEDRFIINGISYRPTGDTQVAQAKDEALVFLIILKRDRDSKFTDESWIQPFVSKALYFVDSFTMDSSETNDIADGLVPILDLSKSTVVRILQEAIGGSKPIYTAIKPEGYPTLYRAKEFIDQYEDPDIVTVVIEESE